MTTIGKVDVRVIPDLSGFRQKVATELAAIKDIKIGLNPDLEGFRQKVRAGLTGLKANVDVDYDRSIGDRLSQGIASSFRREAPAIQRTVRDTIAPAASDALSSAIKGAEQAATKARREQVTTERELRRIRLSMLVATREMATIDERDRKAVADMQRIYDKMASDRRRLQMRLTVDRETSARAEAELRAARARMQAQASADPVKIPVTLDRDRLRDAATGLQTRLMSAFGSAASFGAGVLKAGTVGIFGATAIAGVAAMGLQIIPIAAALSQMAGATPLIAAGLGGAALAVGAIAIGANGVLDAIKSSGDAEKYAEAIKGLTPAARSFVQAVVGLKPAFADLQKSVSTTLFDGLSTKVEALATNFFPALKTSLTGVAGGLNTAVKSLLDTIGSSKFGRALDILGSNTGKGISAAAPGLGFFTQGMASLSAGASAFFERAGNAFSSAGRRFSDWVDRVVGDGSLDRWINNAIMTFKQVGSILGNVFGGLGGIFSAMASSGAGMLDRFSALTARFDDWAHSTGGQDAIKTFFRSVSDVTGALTPVGAALMGLVPTISTAIAGIATTFAPFLTQTINNLRPAFESLGGLLQDIAPHLGGFLTSISENVAPFIKAIGPGVTALFSSLNASGPDIGKTLVNLGKIGSGVLQGIADVLPSIASFLAKATGVISDFVSAIGPVPAAIAAFVAALAIKGIAGGGGGLKGAAIAGGLALMLDSASRGIPKSGAAAGAQWAEGVIGGAAAGLRIGGPFGAVIGALAGTAAAFAPTFKKAGTTLWNSLVEGATGKEAGDNFTFSVDALLKNPLSFGAAIEVQGKGTHKYSSAADKALSDKNKAEAKAYYDGLAELYKIDYESAKKYEGAKLLDHQARADAAVQIERELAAKNIEFAERGAGAREAAEARAGAAAQRAADQAIKAMSDVLSTSDKSSEGMKRATATSEGWASSLLNIGSNARQAASESVEAFDNIEAGATTSATATQGSWATSLLGIDAAIASTSAQGQGWFTSLTGIATTSATTAQGGWAASMFGINSAIASTSASGQGWFAQLGFFGQNSATQAGGTWVSQLGLAKNSVWNFYGAFNNTLPQDASARQAAGVVGTWAGMGGRGTWLGSLFGAGLADGINSAHGRVVAAASRLAAAAADAVKMAARIQSPSRVAMELGGYFGEGLAIGIEQKASRVRAAATATSGAAALGVDFGADLLRSAPDRLVVVDEDGQLLMNARIAAGSVVEGYDRNQGQQARFGVAP